MIAIAGAPWHCFYGLLPGLAGLPAKFAGGVFRREITHFGWGLSGVLGVNAVFLTSFYPF
jgi:hypothetical protein